MRKLYTTGVGGAVVAAALLVPIYQAQGTEANLPAARVETTCPDGHYCLYEKPNFEGYEAKADEEGMAKAGKGKCFGDKKYLIRSVDNRSKETILGYTDVDCKEGEIVIGPGEQAADVKLYGGLIKE